VVSDLQQAIDLLTWCVDQASADGKQRARFLRDLADAYRVGAETDHRPDMLDGAVDALREVVALRSVPGYKGFLTPARFAVLRNAAQRGPVVVRNASPYRCDALIVRIRGVDVVPLPVTNEDVLARVNRYGDAVNELNRAAQTLAGRQAAENELRQVLA
jgi:hypothetical protein